MTFAGKKVPDELPLPEQVRISPSKINPWRGPLKPGNRYTSDQHRYMHFNDIDYATVEFISVRSTVTKAEMWWPATESAPVYVFNCPIVERKRGGVLVVVSPAGMLRLVTAQGKIIPSRYDP